MSEEKGKPKGGQEGKGTRGKPYKRKEEIQKIVTSSGMKPGGKHRRRDDAS